MYGCRGVGFVRRAGGRYGWRQFGRGETVDGSFEPDIGVDCCANLQFQAKNWPLESKVPSAFCRLL